MAINSLSLIMHTGELARYGFVLFLSYQAHDSVAQTWKTRLPSQTKSMANRFVINDRSIFLSNTSEL